MPFVCEFDPETQGGKYISDPGDYTCTITGFENTVSDNGNPITNFKILTTSGKEGKFPVYHTAKAAYKMVHLGEACDVKVLEGKRLTFNEKNFVGKKLVVRFVAGDRLDKNGNPYPIIGKDKAFFPASMTTQQQAVKPKPTLPSDNDSLAPAGDNDDLPF